MRGILWGMIGGVVGLWGMSAGAETVMVKPVPVQDLKAVFATVESKDEAAARVRTGGTVVSLTVDEGDMVTAGQVLAVVKDDKIPLQLSEVDARKASLEAQLKQAQQDLGRAQQLRAGGSGTQQRVDDAQAAVDTLKGQIAAVVASRAVLEQQATEGQVLAPTAGRVLHVAVVEGAVVMAGETVATLATDHDLLRLRLPERHARFLHEGDPLFVGARGLEVQDTGLTTGQITKVYPRLENGLVQADADAPHLERFFVGERVLVYVATDQRQAIVLPPAALSRQAGTDFVTLASGQKVPVQVGGPIPALANQTGGVEVLSGLHAGDEITVPAADQPVEKMPAEKVTP